MNVVLKLSVCLLILLASCCESVENSIVSTVEHFESIENLPVKKFTKNQFREISQVLENVETKIRLVSYNMLFNLYDHNLEEQHRWPNRIPRIVELIREMKPDIINTQELYPDQVQDIVPLLANEFSFFPGQKDKDGESFGIFYRTDRFELISTVVLYPISVVQLKDLKTDKVVCVCNTHMPFSNIEAREANARKIVELMEPFAAEAATILTGDLNTFSTRLDLTALPFYDGDYIHRILSSGPLKDAHYSSLLGHFGPISTFTNNGTDVKPFEGTGTPGIILDYIYVSDKIVVLAHAVEPGTVNGHFPSDHMPIFIDFLIK